MNCSICNARPAISTHSTSTCGDSYCQEAAYYRNLAKNSRGRRSGAAWKLAADKAEVAARHAERRMA